VNTTSVNLSLSINETQAILASLAKQPFEQVADLWFKIKNEAEQQIAKGQAAEQVAEPIKSGGTD
jgi:hypothetical protein